MSAADAGAVVADLAITTISIRGALASSALAASQFPAFGNFTNITLALRIFATGPGGEVGAFACGWVTELTDGAVTQLLATLDWRRRATIGVRRRWTGVVAGCATALLDFAHTRTAAAKPLWTVRANFAGTDISVVAATFTGLQIAALSRFEDAGLSA